MSTSQSLPRLYVFHLLLENNRHDWWLQLDHRRGNRMFDKHFVHSGKLALPSTFGAHHLHRGNRQPFASADILLVAMP